MRTAIPTKLTWLLAATGLLAAEGDTLFIRPSPAVDSMVRNLPGPRSPVIVKADSTRTHVIGAVTDRRHGRRKVAIACTPDPAIVLRRTVAGAFAASGETASGQDSIWGIDMTSILMRLEESLGRASRELRATVSCKVILRRPDGTIAREFMIQTEESRKVLSVARHVERLAGEALSSCATQTFLAVTPEIGTRSAGPAINQP